MPTDEPTTALVLAGGGARAHFQARIIDRLHRRGVRWDLVAGVSAGALNAAMVSTGRTTYLEELWRDITRDDLFTEPSWMGAWLWRAVQVIRGRKESIYDTEPLRQLLRDEYDPSQTTLPAVFGCVSLRARAYTRIHVQPALDGAEVSYQSLDDDRGGSIRVHGSTSDQTRRDFVRHLVMASASIPVAFPPVRLPFTSREMRFGGIHGLVDGGLRNISPLSDVISHPLQPERIIVILNKPEQEHDPDPVTGLLPIIERTQDIVLDEILRGDLERAHQINRLVAQAEHGGVTLRTEGRPLRTLDIQVLRPKQHMGSFLDFSDTAKLRRIREADRIANRYLSIANRQPSRAQRPVADDA